MVYLEFGSTVDISLKECSNSVRISKFEREAFDFGHKTPKRLPMVSQTIYYHNLISVLVVAAFYPGMVM